MARKNYKQEIIKAASMLLSENGYAALNMRAIANRAGIKAASIYNHFSSKDEIVFLLMFEGRQILSGMLADGIEACDSLDCKIFAYLDNFINFGFKYPEYYKIIFMTAYPPESMTLVKDKIAREIEPGLKTLASILAEHLSISRTKSMYIGETLFHIAHGHVSLSILGRPDFLFDVTQCRKHLENIIKIYVRDLKQNRNI